MTVLGAVALVALLVSACASSASGGAPAAGTATTVRAPVPVLARAQHTVTHVVHAFRADGQAAVRVAATVNGSCFTASIAAAGSHAYRCVAGNALLDPCLAPPGSGSAKTVVCLADPWSAATVVRLTAALPTPTPTSGSTARPWAIQLADGTRCVTVTGTVSQSHGVALTYRCNDGGAASTPRAGRSGRSEVAHVASTGTFTPAVAVAAVWRI